jgi:hypothetical protein
LSKTHARNFLVRLGQLAEEGRFSLRKPCSLADWLGQPKGDLCHSDTLPVQDRSDVVEGGHVLQSGPDGLHGIDPCLNNLQQWRDTPGRVHSRRKGRAFGDVSLRFLLGFGYGLLTSTFEWGERWDSNPRHPGPQPGALTS